MPFNIIYFRDGREVGNTPWAGTFESAKTHAKNGLAIHNASRVEIREDSTRELLFHHPRTLKPI